MSHVMNTYARQPVAFVRGEGVWLWDEAGKKYLDALAGIAVNTLGYAHPRLVKALTARIQSGVIHTSNLWRIPDQEAAADRVAEITGLDEVFFCNSGLEATEASIKVARKYGHDKGIAEPAIVVLEKAFHGRSLATLSATGSRKVQAGFKPGNPGSTFGGNPLAMTAVVTTIDTIKEEGLLASSARVGEMMISSLKNQIGNAVAEVRGMGLMIGIELKEPCGELVKQALDAGLVINVTADNVVRLLPPLVMSEAEGRQVIERLGPLVKAFLDKRAAA